MHLSAHTLCVCVQVVELLRPFTGQRCERKTENSFQKEATFIPFSGQIRNENIFNRQLLDFWWIRRNDLKQKKVKKNHREQHQDRRRRRGFLASASKVLVEAQQSECVHNIYSPNRAKTETLYLTHQTPQHSLPSPDTRRGFVFFFVLLFAFFLFVVSTHLANPHRRKSNKKN